MQDLLMTQLISSQTSSVSSKKTPQSEFQSRDDATKKGFMDAVRNATSSENTASSAKKTEQPKMDSKKTASAENAAEQQAPEASTGSETILIAVDPSYAVVFPGAIASENAVAVMGESAEVVVQNSLTPQVQVLSAETALKTTVQQTAEQTTVLSSSALSAENQQFPSTGQTAQTTISNTASAAAQSAAQSAAQTDGNVNAQSTNGQSEQNGDAFLTKGNSTESLTDASLVKAQQTNPDTIFVKVGENGMPKEPSQLISQLGEKIQANFASGRQEFEIQLHPQELGKIQIKMSFENGRITVLVHCSNPETQQL